MLRRVGGMVAALTVVAVAAGCTEDSSGSTGADPGTSSGSSAAAVEPRCSEATLEGRYLYEIHGNKRFVEGLLPYLEVGEQVYDGEGEVTTRFTDSATREESVITGTYRLDASCRGVVTYDSQGTHRLLVSPTGDEFTSYEDNPEAPQDGLDGGAVRVTVDPSETCSEETMSGTYVYRSRGFYDRAQHIEHGFETYTGDGAVTNAFAVVGEEEPQYLTGVYEVDATCRAQVTYADGGPTFTQYLSPDGSEFYWIQVAGFSADDAAGLFGGHEHRVTTSTDDALSVRPQP